MLHQLVATGLHLAHAIWIGHMDSIWTPYGSPICMISIWVPYGFATGVNLTFRAPNHCAKFHQNRIKTAAVGVFTDKLTE